MASIISGKEFKILLHTTGSNFSKQLTCILTEKGISEIESSKSFYKL